MSAHDTTPASNGGSSLHLPGASGAFLGDVGSGSPVKNATIPNVQTCPVNDTASFPFPAQSIHTTETSEGEPMSVDTSPVSNNAISSTLPMVWDSLDGVMGRDSGFQDVLMFAEDTVLTCM